MIAQLRERLRFNKPLTQGDAMKLIRALDALDEISECFSNAGCYDRICFRNKLDTMCINETAPKFAEIWYQR